MNLDTPQDAWKVMNQATQTVAAGIDGSILSSAGSTLTVNAPVLAYGSTWANAAQNPAKWPSVSNRIPAGEGYNGMILRFLVADSDNDEVTATIWNRDDTSGSPFNFLVLNPIRAGTAVCNTHPVANTAIGNSLINLAFTSGGTAAVVAGDTITGATSGSTATVTGVTVTSGTWLGGDAVGIIYVSSPSAAFQSENLNTGTQDNICTIAADVTYFRYADTITIATNHCEATSLGTAGDNGIIETTFDLLGNMDAFCDFDCDLGSGTDGTDAICLYKLF